MSFEQVPVAVIAASAALPPLIDQKSEENLHNGTPDRVLVSATREPSSEMVSTMLPIKNINIFWIGLTSLAVWFLFIHSPPILLRRKAYQDFPFASHLLGAYTVYITCIINTLFTPSSLLGKARPFHIWIGRIGYISGLISFCFGAYIAWWPHRENIPPIGFSIGITIGGVAQVISQLAGYRAIRRFRVLKQQIAQADSCTSMEVLNEMEAQKKSALRTHIYNMVALFAVACGAPAGIRLVEMLGAGGMGGLILSLVGLNLVVKPYGDTFVQGRTNNAATAAMETQELDAPLITDEHADYSTENMPRSEETTASCGTEE